MFTPALMSRKEERLLIPTGIKLEPTNGFEEVSHDKPFVTTIYFGKTDSKQPLPTNAAVKLRYYSSKESPQFFTLQQYQTCVLEIKTHPINRRDSSIRNKYRIEGISLADALKILGSSENFENLQNFGNSQNCMDAISALRNIVASDQIDGLDPIGLTTYKRQHFSDGKRRITADSNLSVYSLTYDDRNWWASKKQSVEGQVIEVKSPIDCDIDEKSFSKAELVKDMILDGKKLILEHPHKEMDYAGTEWVEDEREMKIDVSLDPRVWLENIDLSETGLSVGVLYEKSDPQRFIECNGIPICIMGRHELTPSMFKRKTTERVAIKYKVPTGIDNIGIVRRKETLLPYSEENMASVISLLGGNPTEHYESTPSFWRNRALRKIVCSDTGNVFAIIADHCVSDEDSRPPLNQVEIEYQGVLTDCSNCIPDSAAISQDFIRVREVINNSLLKENFNPIPSIQTKFQWISRKI